MSIAIVTDSTACFTDEEINKYKFSVVPLTITLEGENFAEGSRYSNKEFYKKIRTSRSFPTSSQPAVGQFVSAYTKLLEDYDEIVSIHISGNLSGTASSALAAAELVDKKRITVVDSLSAAQGLAAIVIKASNMAVAENKVVEIVDTIKHMADNTAILFLIDSLDYLHKGGRIGGAATLFGNLLQIKPILYLNQDGKVDILEKVRTSKKAEAKLIETATDFVQKLGVKDAIINVVHADNAENALKIEKIIKDQTPEFLTRVSELGPVIGMHVGPGTIGCIITPIA